MIERYAALALVFMPASGLCAPPRQCDVTVTNGNDDATATNIRATPSSGSKVVIKLDSTAPVELHVTGQNGPWFSIDRIDNVEVDKAVFRGRAWIHRSQVVLSVSGGGRDHYLQAAPTLKSARLMKLIGDGHDLDVVECRGKWVKVEVDKKKTGWIDEFTQCSNPLTTCS